MDEPACFQIKLAMSEAVTNAIIHGSASAEDEVEIEASEQADLLVFEVRDGATKPDDGLPFDRLAEGGRGLALVALMMDEVQLTAPSTAACCGSRSAARAVGRWSPVAGRHPRLRLAEAASDACSARERAMTKPGPRRRPLYRRRCRRPSTAR